MLEMLKYSSTRSCTESGAPNGRMLSNLMAFIRRTCWAAAWASTVVTSVCLTSLSFSKM